jgi:Skp family chaperone for outer membrane proteins
MEAELTRIETATSRSLLGEIYKKVQDIARSEGVSIIIDKKSILYGNGAVDLTDKLIEALRTESAGGQP